MTSTVGIDVLIRGAHVVDGTGNPWFRGEVAIAGETIPGVGPAGMFDGTPAGETVDAAGMVVCPGFIDIQSHSIVPLMIDGRCLSKITQGVTTEVMGEKWTPAPVGGRTAEDDSLDFLRNYEQLRPWEPRIKSWSRFGDWLEAMIAHGVSPNIGSFLGGGTVRTYAKGMDEGPASEEELETMRRVVRDAMEDGAFGLAYALIYPPDAFVGTEELVEVCRAMTDANGVYITHMRSEADDFLEAVEETLEIGRRAGVAVEIYHLKVAGAENWPKMTQVIELLNQARSAGQDVTSDMYPYIAGGTGLSSIFPPHLSADGKFYDNLRDPVVRQQARREALQPSPGWEAMGKLCGSGGIYPLGLRKEHNKQYIGKSMAGIAEMRGQNWVDAAIDLLLDEGQRIGTVYFMMSEDNVKLQLQQPWMKISTDAGGIDPAWAAPLGSTHPRSYGTYPRVLGKYVREEGVITLEDAIRKMTSAVARRLSIPDRGLLCPGYKADVVIFDPEAIADHATFEEPHQLSTGVRDVWINGARVLRNGEHTGATPGQIVRGPGYRGSHRI
jgi:N-acyl-D-aspartate/D-glutamate deacylase